MKASPLRKAQHEFCRLLPRLYDKAFSLGFELTQGDGYRDPKAFGEVGEFKAYGHPRSSHKRRLAQDLNLFFNGEYKEGTEAHRVLGEWWEKQHPLARWGGRFGDGNHYSFEWEGSK